MLANLEPQTELARLAELDTPTLRAELASSLGLTAKHLLHLSAIWAELERRGEDLSDLRSGIAVYLSGIAAGTVSPEAVVAFAGRPTILRAVATLPPDEQRRLAAGGTVPLVVGGEAGYSHRMVPLAALPARAISQIFGERCIRSEVGQIAILSAPAPPLKHSGKVTRGNVTVDRRASVVRIGRATAPLDDVLAALRAAGAITT